VEGRQFEVLNFETKSNLEQRNLSNTITYTIGHSNHSAEQFIALLKKYSVTVVADVRSAPYSKYTPQFNKETVCGTLSQVAIRYVFLGRELGARPDDPTCYDMEGKVVYERIIRRPDFAVGIESLIQLSIDQQVAIMCSEKEPLNCHRTILISRYLHERGLMIQHILTDRRTVNHSELEAQMTKPEGDTIDLFMSPEEKAYLRRGQKIAYKKSIPRG